MLMTLLTKLLKQCHIIATFCWLKAAATAEDFQPTHVRTFPADEIPSVYRSWSII